MARPAVNLVAFHNKRGTCEQWIKERKGTVRETRLSCRSSPPAPCGSRPSVGPARPINKAHRLSGLRDKPKYRRLSLESAAIWGKSVNMSSRINSFRRRFVQAVVSVGLCSVSLGPLSAVAMSDELPNSDRGWAVSVFGGMLTENSFIDSLYSINERWANDYLAGVDVTYTYYRLPTLPVDLDIDVTAAKRFGIDHQWDFGVIPMVRWKEFPWNNYICTNFRVGLVGADYVTGISPWELHWAGNGHGSRFLNYLCLELDFKPSAASNFEWYVGWHHRSGIFGLINDTWGGSTYMDTGLRRAYPVKTDTHYI
jgi:hypothetical protein